MILLGIYSGDFTLAFYCSSGLIVHASLAWLLLCPSLETIFEFYRIGMCQLHMYNQLFNTLLAGQWTPTHINDFNNLLTQIQDGKIIFRRTTEESRPYSSSSSEAHVGASLLIRGETRTGEEERGDSSAEYDREAAEGREQERLIEAWAKANDLWLNDYAGPDGKKAPTLEDLLRSQWVYWNQGSEAEVYIYDEPTVLKSINLSHVNDNPGNFLDRIALFNNYYPETALEIVGFGRDSLGHFRIIAFQSFIAGNELTDAELEEFLKALPMKDLGTWYETEDGQAQFSDLSNYNILKDKDGNYFVIDADVVYNTPDRGGSVIFENTLMTVES